MLPGIDGLEVCRRLRADDPHLPVVMLTALGDEADRVVGLSLGGRRLRDQAVLAARNSCCGCSPCCAGRPGPRDVPAGSADVLTDGDLIVDVRAPGRPAARGRACVDRTGV